MFKTPMPLWRSITQFLKFPATGANAESRKLRWLVQLRWIAIGLLFLLAAPAIISGYLNGQSAPVYLGLLAMLTIFNLLTYLWVSENQRQVGAVTICFQMAFDLVILTGLLAISGGFNNPFTPLFLLNVSLGAILISGRLSRPFLLLSHTFLAALQLHFVVKNGGIPLPAAMITTFVAYHILLLGCWLVMRSLGSHLEKQSELQAQIGLKLEKQDRLRALGSLAAGFSHEFASPLNAARIRLERLARQNDHEDVREGLASIHVCQRVIEQMNSSQMDVRDFHFKNIDVSLLLRDVVESWAEMNPEARIQLKIQPAVFGRVPPVNFSQTLLNLLDNAYEASPQTVIEVELRTESSDIHLTIADSGPGFTEHVLRQRGEPFVTTKSDGTGLGLYVSELFAQSLGGSLSLRNRSADARKPGGAEVILKWPATEETT